MKDLEERKGAPDAEHYTKAYTTTTSIERNGIL